MNCHLASAVVPGARLAAAIAPAFTIGFVVPSLVRSIATSELNGKPVLFTPSFFFAHGLANQGEHERFGHALDREFIIGIAGGIGSTGCADHTNAKKVAWYLGQGRYVVSILPFVIRLESLVRFGHQCPYELSLWQLAGRYRRRSL